MFNSEARWDRNLPQETNAPEDLHEKIDVFCQCGSGKITPRSFLWKKRLYRVIKINFYWQERQGRGIIRSYSVQTPAGTYQISFSKENLCWHLEKLLGP